MPECLRGTIGTPSKALRSFLGELCALPVPKPLQYLRSMSHPVIKPYVPTHKIRIVTAASLLQGHNVTKVSHHPCP